MINKGFDFESYTNNVFFNCTYYADLLFRRSGARFLLRLLILWGYEKFNSV